MTTRRASIALVLSIALASTGCLSFHEGRIDGAPKGATFATIKGTPIHYVDEGEGPVVVLIHGFASSMGAWSSIRKALKGKHRVIALDLKGFGHSGRPEGDYSPKAQAEIVLGLLEERGVEGPVALVAHSWGSSVALQVALLAPDRVDRIALYDAWVYADQLPGFFLWSRADGLGEALIGAYYDQRSDEKMAIAFYDHKYVTEELVETVEDQLSRPGTKAAALAAIRGQRFEDVETKYKSIDKPALLLWGREDRVTTLEYGERLSKELPKAKLVVYPQCGHFPMIEAATPSTRDLVAFLGEMAPKAPAASSPRPESPKPEVEPTAPKPEPTEAEPAEEKQQP
ncbi:MAG: alpha/beta hydrolase [Polyangiaceae bacterium]|nr:alpha/beta hydrolase [Polyangiaceae bacterium]